MFTKKIAVASEPNYPVENEEGELTVDVYTDGDNIVIETLIAGLDPDDLDISIAHDLVTIRGERKKSKEISNKNYYYQECYYGEFSRTVLLPTDIDPDKAKANFSKNGVLTIVMPKVERKLASKKLAVEGESEEETTVETKSRRRTKIAEDTNTTEKAVNEIEEMEEESSVNSQEETQVESNDPSDKDWALLSPRPIIKRKVRSSKSQE
jgi:HSP20 family molecular chaperone IbpA